MELLSQFVSMRRAQLSDNTRNVHPTKIADEPLADLRGRELSERERERERACDGRSRACDGHSNIYSRSFGALPQCGSTVWFALKA